MTMTAEQAAAWNRRGWWKQPKVLLPAAAVGAWFAWKRWGWKGVAGVGLVVASPWLLWGIKGD